LRAFAGRFAPGERAGARDLAAALRPDGPADVRELDAFALAWTPADPPPASSGTVLCLIDGRASTARLARRLGADPASPTRQLVAEGYARFGDDVLTSIEGPFAVLLWDSGRARGLVARDRLGMRPLFVCVDGSRLLFASEIRNLLALLPRRPAPDPEAMARWLARTSAADGRTLYSGIERLPAAHAIAFGAGGVERRRYWRPVYAAPRPVDAEEATARVRGALGRAVGRALDGARDPAVLLSGGLDSSAVAATAPAPLRAYSAVFPDDPRVDESGAIARTRDWVGLDGVEAAFRGGSALAAAAEFLRTWEVPSVSPNLFVWLPLLRRAAADGVDVLLDGEGGDELFGCAPYLVADRVRAARPLAALRIARRLPGMGERPPARLLRRALVEYGVRGALPYRLHERLRAARARGDGGPPDPWGWKRTSAPRWWAQLAHALTMTGDALGAPDQLRRTALLAGVERRHPLRDEELIETMLALPPELGFHPTLDRPLARRALAGALPPEQLASDRKPVFNSLLADALKGPDAAPVAKLLADPHPELVRRVRKEAIAELHSGRPSGLAWALDLWRIATLEQWLEYSADPAAGSHPERPSTPEVTVAFETIRAPSRHDEGPCGPSGSVLT
jgi:asparagine synthase (glutamine-hydrolysing)